MRRALVHAFAGLCVWGLALPVLAQDAYPNKPIRLITPLGGTPAQFAEFIRKEHAKWGGAVRDAGIKLD